jgi:hypothetical protein
MVVFGFLGVFPNVHLKEGNIEWPTVEEQKPIKPPVDGQAREEIAILVGQTVIRWTGLSGLRMRHSRRRRLTHALKEGDE